MMDFDVRMWKRYEAFERGGYDLNSLSQNDVVDLVAFMTRQRVIVADLRMSLVAEVLIDAGYVDPQGRVLKYPEPRITQDPRRVAYATVR